MGRIHNELSRQQSINVISVIIYFVATKIKSSIAFTVIFGEPQNTSVLMLCFLQHYVLLRILGAKASHRKNCNSILLFNIL